MKKTGKHTGSILDKLGKYEIIDCQSCKFIHAVPLPSKAELDEFYREHFWPDRRWAVNKYYQQFYWWKMHFKHRLDLIEHLLPGTGKILDIGCGFGFFIKAAQDRGWKAVGLEPSIYACEYSKELYVDVRNCSMDLGEISEFTGYDTVILSSVLEHVIDPRKLLEKARKSLRRGGLLFVTVANEYNPLQEMAKIRLNLDSWWVCPPEHINYFNVESIRGLLESTGFKIESKETTFPIELFLLAGINYIEDKDRGPEIHGYREEIERAFNFTDNWELLASINSAFAELNIGRTAILVGRK